MEESESSEITDIEVETTLKSYDEAPKEIYFPAVCPFSNVRSPPTFDQLSNISSVYIKSTNFGFIVVEGQFNEEEFDTDSSSSECNLCDSNNNSSKDIAQFLNDTNDEQFSLGQPSPILISDDEECIEYSQETNDLNDVALLTPENSQEISGEGARILVSNIDTVQEQSNIEENLFNSLTIDQDENIQNEKQTKHKTIFENIEEQNEVNSKSSSPFIDDDNDGRLIIDDDQNEFNQTSHQDIPENITITSQHGESSDEKQIGNRFNQLKEPQIQNLVIYQKTPSPLHQPNIYTSQFKIKPNYKKIRKYKRSKKIEQISDKEIFVPRKKIVPIDIKKTVASLKTKISRNYILHNMLENTENNEVQNNENASPLVSIGASKVPSSLIQTISHTTSGLLSNEVITNPLTDQCWEEKQSSINALNEHFNNEIFQVKESQSIIVTTSTVTNSSSPNMIPVTITVSPILPNNERFTPYKIPVSIPENACLSNELTQRSNDHVVEIPMLVDKEMGQLNPEGRKILLDIQEKVVKKRIEDIIHKEIRTFNLKTELINRYPFLQKATNDSMKMPSTSSQAIIDSSHPPTPPPSPPPISPRPLSPFQPSAAASSRMKAQLLSQPPSSSLIEYLCYNRPLNIDIPPQSLVPQYSARDNMKQPRQYKKRQIKPKPRAPSPPPYHSYLRLPPPPPPPQPPRQFQYSSYSQYVPSDAYNYWQGQVSLKYPQYMPLSQEDRIRQQQERNPYLIRPLVIHPIPSQIPVQAPQQSMQLFPSPYSHVQSQLQQPPQNIFTYSECQCQKCEILKLRQYRYPQNINLIKPNESLQAHPIFTLTQNQIPSNIPINNYRSNDQIYPQSMPVMPQNMWSPSNHIPPFIPYHQWLRDDNGPHRSTTSSEHSSRHFPYF